MGAGDVKLTGDSYAETDVESYIERVRQSINSELELYYQTPFFEITRKSITRYPYPLDVIVEMWAAGLILIDKYSEAEASTTYTDKGNRFIQTAQQYLDLIKTNQLRLEGQRRKASRRFVSPDIIPLDQPMSSPAAMTQPQGR